MTLGGYMALAADVETLLADAPEAPWSLEGEVVKNREAIKKTWDVECRVHMLTEEQAATLKMNHPMDTNAQVLAEDYQIEMSSNAIFVHPYGAWNDWGYTFFLYKGALHYVNVAPMVNLTEPLYNRTDDLSYMVKVFIVLGRGIGAEHEKYLVRVDGDFKQL
jgi:hypothetical protein